VIHNLAGGFQVKRLFKKNQIIITTFAVMIAIAGYMNYSGQLFEDGVHNSAATNAELANKELLDISEEDLMAGNNDIASFDSDFEGIPGEAVLTGSIATTLAQAKMTREQVRSQNKETLQLLIDNPAIGDQEKQVAISEIVKLTEQSEQELAIETLMSAKGFSDAVVSLTGEFVDVVVVSSELSDANRAQIEDIISRKTNISPENIVITPIRD